MKSFLYYASLIGSSFLVLLLLWYVSVLLLRTNFGAQATSISQDVIWIVYGTSLVGCALATLSLFLCPIEKRWSILIMAVGILLTIIFATLHIFGTVGEYIKEG